MNAMRWNGDTKFHLAMNGVSTEAICGVPLPLAHHYQNMLQLQHDPEYDKAVTKDNKK